MRAEEYLEDLTEQVQVFPFIGCEPIVGIALLLQLGDLCAIISELHKLRNALIIYER